jgi:hypothetical protein
MENEFRICISSPQDREKLVAEIFFDDIQWAEISQDGFEPRIEIYPRPDGRPWNLSVMVMEESIVLAKARLLGNSRAPNSAP